MPSTGQSRYPVARLDRRFLRAVAILHQVGVFRRVVIIAVQHGDRPEPVLAEEQLGGQVRLADLQQDPQAALRKRVCRSAWPPFGCRRPAAGTPGSTQKFSTWMPRLVQLVDHEAHDPVFMFGDHADAIPLPQTADKIVVHPGELEVLPVRCRALRACRDGSSSGCGHGLPVSTRYACRPPSLSACRVATGDTVPKRPDSANTNLSGYFRTYRLFQRASALLAVMSFPRIGVDV